jgi:hypothetical protein
MTSHQQTWWPLHHQGVGHSVNMPLDSNPEFAHLLGKVVERWASLESELMRCLAALLDDNEPAARAIIYSLNSTSNRIGIVKAVARELLPDGPEKSGFVWLLDKINDLQKERNGFIHGEYWHAGNSGLELMLIRPSNPTPVTIRPVRENDLKRHLALCEEWEFQLSLARDENPERRVPNMTRIRQRALSRCRLTRVATTPRNS